MQPESELCNEVQVPICATCARLPWKALALHPHSAVQGKANPATGNLRGLNLAAVKRTTVQVSRLLLQSRLQMTEHDLLY
jgi:hypothetical protein